MMAWRKGMARLALPALLALASGCASTGLDPARSRFYAGQSQEALTRIPEFKETDRNGVLFLEERGTIRQGAGDYAGSAADYIRAAARLDQIAPLSITKDTASFVINDNVQTYAGPPYERALLHAMTLLAHLAQTNWDHAAVEGRRITQVLAPNARGKYPDVAISHYLAGLSFQLIDDRSNAALEFRKAAEAAGNLNISETGRIRSQPPAAIPSQPPATNRPAAGTNNLSAPAYAWPEARPPEKPEPRNPKLPCELVCIVLLGGLPSGVIAPAAQVFDPQPYAEIFAGDQRLGRTRTLTYTLGLAVETERQKALIKAAKEVTRLAVKYGISQAVAQQDASLGSLTFLALLMLDQPDTRRWETLPRWFQVARVPCPANLKEVRLEVRGGGIRPETVVLTAPLVQRDGTYVAIFRQLPADHYGVAAFW